MKDTEFRLTLLHSLNTINETTAKISKSMAEIEACVKKVNLYPEDLKTFQDTVDKYGELLGQMGQNVSRLEKDFEKIIKGRW